ncbi:SDR family NAD(P)-dependent oxidoreductase [Gammaproteobacteria bacterium]|nr:SDR family NAD(P)-dependent oxidoreductase [Gammaproteobacteria bacterium]
MYDNIIIFGVTGTMGNALYETLSARYPQSQINGVGRQQTHPNKHLPYHCVDFSDENALQTLATSLSQQSPFDLILVTIGMLHNSQMMPEKSIHELYVEKYQQQFMTNTIIPMMIAKHFIPHMQPQKRSILGIFSAKVGSITDNSLGGWYSYRASKAALNMQIKNLSIECKRSHPNQIILGLHPGTVDSQLSKPFQKNLPPSHQIFNPLHASEQVIDQINAASSAQSGKLISWDGSVILP